MEVSYNKILAKFSKYSKIKKGFLNQKEFLSLVNDLYLSIDINTAANLFLELDPFKTGSIPITTFANSIAQRNSVETDTNANKIIQMISHYDTDEVEWAIKQIKGKKIYNCEFEADSDDSASIGGEEIQTMYAWINEYSQKQDPINYIAIEEGSKPSIAPESSLSLFDEYMAALSTIESPDFDIFQFCTMIGRESALVMLSFYTTKLQSLLGVFNPNKMFQYLKQIYKGYSKDTPYHTDIHAADVTQMCNMLLSKGHLRKLLCMDKLETLGFLLSAIVHDYKHMGLNNAFHENKKTKFAIRYNDISILENYHVAQAFKEMRNPELNVLDKIRKQDYTKIRKLITHCVLATDAQKHSNQLSALQAINVVNDTISLDKSSPIRTFENKIDILGMVLHAADISNSTRKFPVYQQWTYRLMEEFWRQGDIEKQFQLPISYLCDRKTANVPACQVGFINGITKPLFSIVARIMPSMQYLVDNICENEINWKMLQLKQQFEQKEQAKEEVQSKN